MEQVIHFSTLQEYCKGINISPPLEDDFDLRSFRDNMKTVHQQMPRFKHEFYAIALKLDGGGYAQTGTFSTKDLKATVFFNSPYQILQWDIAPDWDGYYIIFTEEFVTKRNPAKRITEKFPFLLIDNTVPIVLASEEIQQFEQSFDYMLGEIKNRNRNSAEIIYHHILILLYKVERLFAEKVPSESLTYNQRNQDLQIVSRFKMLVETSFFPDDENKGSGLSHQVQHYAEKLHIHPNHLNAIVKRITGYPASEIITQHMVSLAKTLLREKDKSIKEIAYQLQYNYPNHFANFFKKQTGITPTDFRSSPEN